MPGASEAHASPSNAGARAQDRQALEDCHHATNASVEAYTLQASARHIRLCGVGAPGAFYAAVTLMQLARPSAAAAIPLVSIADHPDLPTRGYEVEDRIHGDNFAFFRSVADTLASLKLNWCEIDMHLPISYNYTSAVWTYPSDAWVAKMRDLLAYFKALHIEAVLPVGSKWDPRTIEGKAVAHEPFHLGADGTARATRPAALPLVNGDFEQLRADGTPLGWELQRGSDPLVAPPCSVDATHAASGKHSIRCDVQQYPDPAPPSSGLSSGLRGRAGPRSGGGPRGLGG